MPNQVWLGITSLYFLRVLLNRSEINMRATDFLEKLHNFKGDFDELNELYYDYVENSEDPIEQRTSVILENAELIGELMEKTSKRRNSELPFNYYNLYNFQYKFLLLTYFIYPDKIRNNSLYDLYLDYCSAHGFKPEFESKCFNKKVINNGFCDVIICEFLIPEAAIQPLLKEIHFPNIVDNFGREEPSLPFTIEYGGKEKLWLCVHSVSLASGLKRMNLNKNVYGKDDDFIQNEIIDIIDYQPAEYTA